MRRAGSRAAIPRLTIGLAVLMSASAAAADIEEIIVVAHRDARPVAQIAATVTSISHEQMQDEMSTSIADLFRYVPGVDPESGGPRFGATGVNLRGIGGNRVAMLVDGVPLSDGFDVGSFSNATRDFIDTGIVDRIEVLHGPASALYGSAALGGVLAVTTPSPWSLAAADGIGGELTAAYGSAEDGTRGSAVLAAAGDTHAVLLGLSLQDAAQQQAAAVTESVDRRDARRTTALIRTDSNVGNGTRFGLMLLQQAANIETDIVSPLGSGRFRSTTALRGSDDYGLDVAQVRLQLEPKEAIADNIRVQAYRVQSNTRQQTLDERGAARVPVAIDRSFRFRQETLGADVTAFKDLTIAGQAQRLAVGIEYRQRRSDEYRDGFSTDLASGTGTNVILGEVFPLRDFPISESREWAAFAELTWFFDRFSVIAGVRADDYRLRPASDAIYAEDYPFAKLVRVDAADLSPKLGLVWSPGDAMEVYLQYAHGFRAPPFADANIGLDIPFFNYRAIGNPDLRSETSDGFEIGLRRRGARVDLRGALYDTRYEDFIESKRRIGVDPVSGRVLFQSQNLHETHIRGLEAAADIRLDNGVSAGIALHYSEGRNLENDQALNSVGPAQAVLRAGWQSADERHAVDVTLSASRAWDRRDETRAAVFKPPGYAVVDLRYRFRVGETTRLRFAVDNLGDRVYWHWPRVSGLAPDDPLLPYLSSPGRHYSVSFSYAW